MSDPPFADLPRTCRAHFRLYFYAAVLRVLQQAATAFNSWEEAFERFPFLAGYNNELAAHGLEGLSTGEAADWWRAALFAWEESVPGHLPLRALRQAPGLDHQAVVLLLTIGLVEEDIRFGPVFEAMHGIAGQPHPTLRMFQTWDEEDARILRGLEEGGLVQTPFADAPRPERLLHVPPPLWDLLRGEPSGRLGPWARYTEPSQLIRIEDLILPPDLRQKLMAIPELLRLGEVQLLVIRGPARNSRRTILGAVARSLGRGLLEIDGTARIEEDHRRLIGPVATLLHALPALVLDLAPAETAELVSLSAYEGPRSVVLGRNGGLKGDGIERAVTVVLEMPGVAERREHWLRALAPGSTPDLDGISGRARLTAGNIRRAAALAGSYAALAGRTDISAADVQVACRSLNRQALETLAARIEVSGDWSRLAVNDQTRRELLVLEGRCRCRERLPEFLGPAWCGQINAGVRALLTGPSGTGKTLAARLLASVLGMDLYRLDLSSVVNKYIGETEKNLNQLFARAEELDVILLLDEGDALLTQRTQVQSSNDRYANLETNYLLQRLETYEGILLVTTNAVERIDGAFQRRMDVVIEFRSPDVEERWAIWQLHLPPTHAVPPVLLSEVANRCLLSGGQIRNAVLHASLLAADNGGVVTGDYFQAGVLREYRKAGALCPLRGIGTSRG